MKVDDSFLKCIYGSIILFHLPHWHFFEYTRQPKCRPVKNKQGYAFSFGVVCEKRGWVREHGLSWPFFLSFNILPLSLNQRGFGIQCQLNVCTVTQWQSEVAGAEERDLERGGKREEERVQKGKSNDVWVIWRMGGIH